MPLKLISGGGGSVILSANSTGSNYTVTMPAENGVAVTSGATTRLVPRAALPAGSLIQVVSTLKTDQWTVASGTPTDVSGMSLSITPTSVTSKILVRVAINISLSGNGGDGFVRLLRDSTTIGNGNGGFFGQVAGQDYYGVHTRCIDFLDSPATVSSTTYKVQGWCGGNTLYVNGRGLDGGFVTSSSIVAMEIAQ